ncbi:hypothetical protein Pcinc_023813 [Petrolisthes cinctipes]|uniref:UPF0547 domain-containing protein n=1 Tax=Petrolisthes cinctipes TaxID=88211 RepID=A0AAE1FBN1_PETCI|nr:hypothetical protein Pcinc_023813 [Petrolisthes cinctipes]
MPPKSVNKAVSKKCPECRKQVPVATKHCQCGHQFFEERRKSTASNASEVEELDDSSPKDMKPSRGAAGTTNTGTGTGTVGIAPTMTKTEIGSPAPEGKRRSERVKREKPNFYDALEYDNQMRKARKERQKEDPPHPSGRVKRERKVKNNSEPDEDDDDEPVKEKKKKKKKKNNNNGEKKEEEVDEDIMTGISPEKEMQYSIVLSDINFKLGLNNPRFIKI